MIKTTNHDMKKKIINSVINGVHLRAPKYRCLLSMRSLMVTYSTHCQTVSNEARRHSTESAGGACVTDVRRGPTRVPLEID